MKIKLVTVGKLKEKYLKEGIAEYSKRLSRFTKVEIIELADEKTPDKASPLENQQILSKEGERILSKVLDREFVIVLAIEGQQFPSEKFSKVIEDASVRGFSDTRGSLRPVRDGADRVRRWLRDSRVCRRSRSVCRQSGRQARCAL